MIRLPLLIALSAALVGCASAGADAVELARLAMPEVETSRATKVEVATVSPSPVTLTLELPGEVTGSEDALLAAGEAGIVERVLVDDGDAVRRGQVLVELDRAVLDAQIAQAEAQLDQARSEVARLTRLGDLTTDQAAVNASTSVRTAEANLTMLKARVARTRITAPFSGVVGAVAVEPGEYVQPGAPVARLVALDPVRVSLSVSDRDVVALRDGMEARVRSGASTGVLLGTVAHISPVADLATRSFLVRVDVENGARTLLPGMIARVEVDRIFEGDRLMIPQDWLVTRGASYGVFVVVDGRASWRELELEEIVGQQVLLRDGLEPGARVVLTGQHDLVDGEEVLVVREGACCVEGRVSFPSATAANR